eukprot:TRINITY_DN2891_c0_g1_i6.p2 TRINITY_DN2891_c0_g1~~TRINITY_DN2891_c0_g1_i6.p2  ORF type:complete len:103 (+),score=20.44 TRINITY_DN2891_c0_g1_i6:40-348(+)
MLIVHNAFHPGLCKARHFFFFFLTRHFLPKMIVPPEPDKNPLVRAAVAGRLAEVIVRVTAGASPNTVAESLTFQKGQGILSLAAQSGHKDMVLFLLSKVARS